MPQFTPGSLHTATVKFTNQASVSFIYDVSFCLGTAQTEVARTSFSIPGGQSLDVVFSITMPSAVGSYPVYIKVSSGGKLIGIFTATDPVTIVEPAWGGITFSNLRTAYPLSPLFIDYNVKNVTFTITNPGNSPVKTVLKYSTNIDSQIGIYNGVDRWTEGRLIGTYQLAPGESRLISFVLSVSMPGNYNLWLGCGSDIVPIPQQVYGWWGQLYDSWSAFNKSRYLFVSFG